MWGSGIGLWGCTRRNASSFRRGTSEYKIAIQNSSDFGFINDDDLLGDANPNGLQAHGGVWPVPGNEGPLGCQLFKWP